MASSLDDQDYQNFADRASDWYKDIVFCGLYDLQGFGNAYKFYYAKEKRRKLPLEIEMEMAKKCFQVIVLSGEKLSTHKVSTFVMFKYLFKGHYNAMYVDFFR